MAKQRAARSSTSQAPVSSYDQLARRIQGVISTPRAQVEHQAVIHRQDDESPQDWGRLLEEIRDAEGVTMTAREDGGVHLAWYVEPSDC